MSPVPADRLAAPIIILGAPRSGTTLIANVLGGHPGVALANEPRMVWRYGNDRRSDELRREHATPAVVSHVHASFARLLREHGAARLVEKTPSNSVRPAFVHAVFPDARFVHITRDGWGAVPSMRDFWERRGRGFDTKQVRKLIRRVAEARPSQIPFYAREVVGRAVRGPTGRVPLYGPRLAGLQDITAELGKLEAAALQWRACVDQSSTFGRTLGAGQYLELRLEQLDPEAIRELLGFCGLSQDPLVLERFEGVYRREAATHQADLTVQEQALVAPSIEPANTWLGYPPRPLQTLVPPPEAPATPPLQIAYIVGAKNCGSTMLDALIGQAEGAHSLGEVGGFPRFADGGLCGCGKTPATCTPCHAVVDGLDRSRDLDRLPALFRLPNQERRILWTLLRTSRCRQYARVSDRMFALAAEATRSRLLVDSSKNISRAAALALDGEHDVRVIHLIRDGRGFLASRERRAGLDGRTHRPITALAGWFAKNLAVTALLRPRLGEDRYLLCRYEDLLEHPDAALDRIGGFLGADLRGVAARALGEGVSRTHLFEPQRRFDYELVRLEPARLASQQWSRGRNLAYWLCGGFVSALWRYDQDQSYLDPAVAGPQE